MFPRPTIEAFDKHLVTRGLRLEAIVIGGSALGLLGVIHRPTRDFDILAPELPAEISAAAKAFAGEQRELGVELIDDWLNNGPMQLTEVLPDGWRLRAQPLFKGTALVLDTLGRADLLKTKLFALCDRGTDLSDCVAMAPTATELDEALPWVALQDANPDWPAHVEATINDLKKRLGHGVNRAVAEPRPSNDVLTARMAGIGMNFATTPERDADIEGTLVQASALGMDDADLRVLSVLTTWLGVHHAHVNADRLIRLVAEHQSPRVHAYWAAIASWLSKDRRFARLSASEGAMVDLLTVGTDFQLKRKGEDERFVGSKLRVPRGTLRDRAEDVLSPEALVKRHAGYRNRVVIGPTWRADVWTVLEQAPGLTVAEAARRASCSFATAWQTAKDFKLLHPSTK